MSINLLSDELEDQKHTQIQIYVKCIVLFEIVTIIYISSEEVI